ncbi:MAG TPA: hypothetical protein DHW49_08685, partial [Anaerolineae bacterium]|nr:hypothetical protein [Anaerolineae bacterium]
WRGINSRSGECSPLRHFVTPPPNPPQSFIPLKSTLADLGEDGWGLKLKNLPPQGKQVSR